LPHFRVQPQIPPQAASRTLDGETIDFVLDTGATNILPEKVLKQVGDGGPAERGTSFLARSLYEKWHKKHPEWRALENARTPRQPSGSSRPSPLPADAPAR